MLIQYKKFKQIMYYNKIEIINDKHVLVLYFFINNIYSLVL